MANSYQNPNRSMAERESFNAEITPVPNGDGGAGHLANIEPQELDTSAIEACAALGNRVQQAIQTALDDAESFDASAIIEAGLKASSVSRAIASMYNLGYQLKCQVFLERLKARKVPQKKIDQRVKKYRQNPSSLLKELNTIQKVLDDALEEAKAKYLANAYAALLSGEIEFAIFQELSEVIRHLFAEDVPLLKKYIERKSTAPVNASPIGSTG